MFGSFWVFRSFLKLEFLFGEEMKLVLYWKLIVVCVVFFFMGLGYEVKWGVV